MIDAFKLWTHWPWGFDSCSSGCATELEQAERAHNAVAASFSHQEPEFLEIVVKWRLRDIFGPNSLHDVPQEVLDATEAIMLAGEYIQATAFAYQHILHLDIQRT